MVLIALLLWFSGGQKVLAFYEDFNRNGVSYTHNVSKLGWYWQASGASAWSLKSHEIYVNNGDSSLQQNDQTLYNTRVPLESGNWSASVDVRDETSTRRVGLIFMAGPGGTSFYQIRLQFGSQQVQVLENGPTGAQVIYSANSSSEVFDTGNYYTISAWSTNAGQFNWNITNAGSNVNWTSRPTRAGYEVASGSFTDPTFTSGYAGVIKSVGDGSSDVAHFDNFYVREITVPPITQPHPRLLISAADIPIIKGAINAKVEPRYSAWLDLKYYADGWSKDPPVGVYKGTDAMTFFTTAKTGGSEAAKMALAYLLKGNAAHLAGAKAVLLAWAQATPMPGTNFPASNPNNWQSGMLVARGITGFVYTYDFLYNYLTPTERTTVETWFRGMLPSIQAGIDDWNTPSSSDLNTIYYSQGYYQNHTVSPTMGYVLIGCALGDQSLVQFALDSKENPRSYPTLYEGTILMSGETFPNVGPMDPMTPPPQDGEMWDRERHVDHSVSPNGVGLAYAGLSRNQMTAMTEVLYNCGLNFYTRTGAHGENMLLPFNFYADFYRLGDASIKGGFYTGEGVAANYHATVFEVANKRYPGNSAITALLNSTDRAAMDPGGNTETYFIFPTLTHGVVASWTGAATTGFEVASNWEAYVAANDLTTDIAHFDVTPAHQPRLTASRAVAGLEMAVSGLTLSAAGAQVLTLGASGISSGNASTGMNTISAALKLASNQTWSVSAGSTLVVSGAIGGAAGWTKSGPGTVRFSGTNSYAGQTTINAGKLVIRSASATTNTMTVAADATLGVTVAGSAQLAPRTLKLNGATVEFTGVTEVGTAPINAGTLNKNGTTTIDILSGVFAAGQSYPLIHYTTTTGTGAFVLGALPLGVIGTLVTNGSNLVLNIDSVDAIVWTGNVNGYWNTTTLNWSDSSGATTYTNGSAVLFDDTATGSTSVTNAVTVSPGAMLFNNNTKNYTISGSAISGSGGMTKNGSGTLTLTSNNSYTGPTYVNAGRVDVNGAGYASYAAVRALGATGAGNDTTVASGAQVTFTDPNFHSTAESFTINGTSGGGGVLFFNNSNWTLTGGMALGSDATIRGLANTMSGTITLGSYTLTVAKNSGVSETWSAIISGTGELTQAGLGPTTKLTLTGSNPYTGDTTVSAGILALSGNGSIGGSQNISVAAGATFNVSAAAGFTLGSGQTLRGNGTVVGAVKVNGVVSPGDAIGTLTFGSAPTLSGTVVMEINSPANSDRLVASAGTLNYGGSLTVTNLGGNLQLGDTFQLFSAPAYGPGNFAVTNLPALSGGLAWAWTPNNGTLSVVTGVAATLTVTFQDGAAMYAGGDTYSGTADTQLHNVNAQRGWQYGGANPIFVRDRSDDDEGLIRFDMSGFSSVRGATAITSATLTLTTQFYNPIASDNEFSIYLLGQMPTDANWIEGTGTGSASGGGASYSNKYATTTWSGTSNYRARGAVVSGVTAVNVNANGTTDFVLNASGIAAIWGWINGTVANGGFLVLGAGNTNPGGDPGDTGGYYFHSREHGTVSYRPKLTIVGKFSGILIADDFESYTPNVGGNLSPSWSNTGNVFATGSQNQSPIHHTPDDGQGAQLKDISTINNPTIERGFTANTLSTLYIQFDYKYTGTVVNPGFQLKGDGLGSPALNLMMGSAGNVQNKAGLVWSGSLATLSADTWYRFTLSVDPAATVGDNYDLLIQSLVGTELDVTHVNLGFQSEVGTFDKIRFHFNVGVDQMAGEYAVDNVLVTGDASDLDFSTVPPHGTVLIIR